MSDDGLGQAPGRVDLMPHDPRWARAFETETRRLAKVMPPEAWLHHIGSASVPDLAAKPILDLALVARPEHHAALSVGLERSGYAARGERSGLLFIKTRNGRRTHNLHVYSPDAPELGEQIAFRDRLRADRTLRDAYAALKTDLARRVPRGDYAEAKGPIIRAALGR
ncbi:GrpB family protein [Jannaschia aquimarina]|uniref:Dephospho-CoA kinase/protein folding accessory domain-containing protein n=1 Tax=Jannaschia aquimarina TaxID=935700 RepID=A0A0D1EM32_9RHOB|nr:GrpB family protein [Jannaschia aquimarina]KIT18036.1 dephospho-CoA kinase/protein folding accessory domain-containing protein [Jannaschia aquimarina]SNS88996.1 GrpB domain, predicted nucleotidyltransferase, UPF0157 family [Jannaschia aquimarina]